MTQLQREDEHQLEAVAQHIVHQIGHVLVPNGTEGIKLRQSTNDTLIDFVKSEIRSLQPVPVSDEGLETILSDYFVEYHTAQSPDVLQAALDKALAAILAHEASAVLDGKIEELKLIDKDVVIAPDCPDDCEKDHWHHVVHSVIEQQLAALTKQKAAMQQEEK